MRSSEYVWVALGCFITLGALLAGCQCRGRPETPRNPEQVATKAPARDFITTWRTTSRSKSITIPTNESLVERGETYNYRVDWGDGSQVTAHPGDATHTYAKAGVYAVRIKTGGVGEAFPAIFVGRDGFRGEILSVEVHEAGVRTMRILGHPCI